MGYLDYYSYQTEARGVQSFEDVCRHARDKGYIYDRIVLPWLPAEKAGRITEIACGHGSFLWWLKQQQYTQVTGVDSSPEQIHFARQAGATVYQMNAMEWLGTQPPASQNAVVAIDFIEHVSKDEFMDLLSATQRILPEGGRLIVRYPNGDSPLVGRNLFNDITHVWTYTTNCLQTLGRMHGFTRFSFVDESSAAIRDARWLKVPLCKFSSGFLRLLWWAASKERVDYWSPNIWACLEK